MNWGGRLGGREGELGMLAENTEKGGGGNQVREQGFERNLMADLVPVNGNKDEKRWSGRRETEGL